MTNPVDFTLKEGESSDRASIDRALNTAATVEDVEAIRNTWAERSADFRRDHRAMLDLPYGAAARERLDLFPSSERDAPTLLFFHGGFWRRNSKAEFSFAAAGPLAHGFNVAVVGYTLAPDITIRGIVAQAWQSVTWVHENLSAMGVDVEQIYVTGWSAGAHLAAMVINHPDVKGGLAVSGIYDLKPIQLSSFNETLALNSKDVILDSPIHNVPVASPPLLIAFGERELPEFKRQSKSYFEARQQKLLPGDLIQLADLHHYSTLEQFAQRDSELLARLRELAR